MELITFLLFIPACIALNMTPGPNNLLAMNNARCYGFQPALVASFGRIAAFAVMIALTASGLAVILYASEKVFLAIKLVGAMYLFWIAFQLWRSTSSPVNDIETDKKVKALLQQEFALAAGNPKAILTFTAFLPQFFGPSAPINQQFFILGLTFLVLEVVAISMCALFGIYLRQWFSKPKMARWFNRGCAVVLGVSGGNLLMMNRS